MESDDITTENLDMNSSEEQEEGRRGFCQYTRRLCSRIGFSLCILYLVMGLTAFVFILFYSNLEKILPSTDSLFTLVNILSYVIAIPVMLLFLRKVPEIKIEPKKMRLQKFAMFCVLAMGGGYIFNYIGSVINLLISHFSGQAMEQLNPVMDVLDQMNWLMMVYMVLFAPIVEEFIFRKVILNRLRPLGDRAAILYSAVLFGLLHGNIAQFLYATVIGIVFGYMAVKTGRIFYTVILHMIVNGYSVFIVTALINALASQTVLRVMALGIISLIYIGLSIGAVVVFFSKRRKVILRRGDAPAGVWYKDYCHSMYLNPGNIMFTCIMLYSMIMTIFVN